jgi:cell wall-associated NlpC family hydrolase
MALFDPTGSIAASVKQHALDEYPREAVGCVVASEYQRLVNVAEDKLRSFRVNDYPDHFDAIIHSHTQSRSLAPSAADMASQQATGVPWGIVVTNGHTVTPIEWFGGDSPISPYLGRSFLSGVRDCWTLIRDIYQQEQGVELPNLPRDEDWYQHGIDLLSLANIEATGFRRIDAADVREGDLVLGRIRAQIVNHCGLYVGRGLILHHMEDRLSCREPMRPWQRTIKYFLRHKSMMNTDAEWRLEL